MGSSKQVSGAKHAPQIVVLLDARARVMNVNRSRAGKSFSLVSKSAQATLHDQLHPTCSGECRFSDLWQKAWRSLDSQDSIEWEIDDKRLGRLLRLNLTVLLSDADIELDRRERRAFLTITDITRYRKEYKSLVQRERKLARLLQNQGVDTTSLADISGRYRSFSQQVINAQENERKRIASDLHDSIAQSLGAAKFQVESAVAKLHTQAPDLDLAMFDDVVRQLKGAVEEVRRISTNLAPSMLDDFGLCVALEWLCKECEKNVAGISARCEICIDECDMPEFVKIAVHRVTQEALSNASQHARAANISVSLQSDADSLILTIVDDGCGFDHDRVAQSPRQSRGHGLPNMQQRVAATGGQFTIESGILTGTVVKAHWSRKAVELLASESVL
jgi:signal transduction histidine kinase